MITLISKIFEWRIIKGKAKIDFEYQKALSLRNNQVAAVTSIHAAIVDIEILAGEFFSIVKSGTDLTAAQKETILKPLVTKIFQTKKSIQTNSIILDSAIYKQLEKVIDVLFSYLQKSAYAILLKSEDVFDANGKLLGFVLADIHSISSSDIEKYNNTIHEIEQIRTVELNRIKSLLQEQLRAFMHS